MPPLDRTVFDPKTNNYKCKINFYVQHRHENDAIAFVEFITN